MPVAELIPPVARNRTSDPAPRAWSTSERALLAKLGIEGLRMTRHDFTRLLDEHIFGDRKVMLLDGVVFQESPMRAPHATGIRRGTKVLESVFGPGFDVRPQLPLNLSLYTQPYPDLAVVTGDFLDFEVNHPTTALLVVEISVTTLDMDLGEKADLYAAGGIADYWVIDLNEPQMFVFRDPEANTDSPSGFRYRTRLELSVGDHVAPLAMPNVNIIVSDLLPS